MLLFHVLACQPAAPQTSSAPVTACCQGRGACLPSALIDPKDAQMLDGKECSQGSLCVPNGLQQNKPLRSCTVASTRAEGRCAPDCLPQVLANSAQLARDDCDDGERCVPCYDPISGAFTGACGLASDPGPTAAPMLFSGCCDDAGRCVPDTLVDSGDRARFGRDSCADERALCVPSDVLRGGKSFLPATCTISALGAEGRCLPACLPQVSRDADRLTRETCRVGELCTPCFDPLDGTSTGACELASDPGPRQPATLLSSCCAGLGRCVPRALVETSVQSHLGRDSCGQAEQLCAPEPFVKDPAYVPATCTVSGLDIEGRCLPGCLPEIAAQASRLSQGECLSGHMCAPCFDPFTGKATGSCSFGGDKGPTRPATVLGQCCGGDGRCVPSTALAPQQQTQLGRDSCPGELQLCAPTELVDNPTGAPATCTVASIGAEGRCLLDCLPPVAARASVLARDGCAEHHSCVPCFDPRDGRATGACDTVPGDHAEQPPSKLASCCDGRGRCTPKAWVPADYADIFDQGSCTASEHVCVAPEAALLDPDFRTTVCQDEVLGAEGRCAPTCIAAVRSRASMLRRTTCPAMELCVPCFDPVTGESTGACKGPNDPGPSKPPVVFADCCVSLGASLGTCVPTALLPPGINGLQRETCADSAAVCVPRKVAEDPSAKLPTCDTALSGRGVCMNACFLGSQASVLTRSSCAVTERCVPCSVVGASIGGC